MSGLSVAPSLPVVPLQLSVDPSWFVAVAVVVFLLGAIIAPLLALSLREYREPTAEERTRLDALGVGVDYDPDRVRVTETDGKQSVDVSIRGLPGRRLLLCSEYVLDELDEETATALIAAERARSRHYYIEYRAVAAASIIGIATAMFGGLIDFSDGLFVLAVAALGLFWIGRRLQFRADRIAATRVGSEELADAFETVAALSGVEPESATWRTWFEVQPPLGQRIARLRSRS
jgi:Zn-dependent protease with chaperone function